MNHNKKYMKKKVDLKLLWLITIIHFNLQNKTQVDKKIITKMIKTFKINYHFNNNNRCCRMRFQ